MQNILKRALVGGVFLLAAVVTPRADQNIVVGPILTSPFESYLELLRQQAGIPGLSGAIVKDGQIVWERGFGYANVDARILAAGDTPYYIGDLTETFSAMLLLECVEQRKVGLDDHLSKYGAKADTDPTVRQVLSHTSGLGTDTFKYDPVTFAQVAPVIEKCTATTYRNAVSLHLVARAAMVDTVPGRDLRNPAVVAEGTYDPDDLARFASVINKAAVPYKLDKRGKATRSDVVLVDGINPVDGVLSTVRDLAQLDATLDSGAILLPATLAQAWTNVLDKNLDPLPTGLGWFVQGYHGETIVWHFGQITNGYSGLILKVPARHLSLILLANSDGLSAPFQLGAGDVTKSLFASLFLRLFV